MLRLLDDLEDAKRMFQNTNKESQIRSDEHMRISNQPIIYNIFSDTSLFDSHV